MSSDWTGRIRLRHLKFLLSLAQTRNLSRSAAALHTAQPGLSKWLKDLESDIGLTLFERHACGLAPTAHGHVLIAHARRVEAQLDRAATDMKMAARHRAGARLGRQAHGCGDAVSFGGAVAPPSFSQRFAQSHPSSSGLPH